MRVKFGLVPVVIAANGSFFERAIQPFDLPVGLGVGHFGAAVFDTVSRTDGIEQVGVGPLAVG